MCASRVDLFLGGPLGLWVLDNVDTRQIGIVHSEDQTICQRAINFGLRVAYSNSTQGGDFGLSMHYPFILPQEVIERYVAIYNIHPALLPYGRCYYPVFWALWAGEPAGATLHQIDAGVDTGPIVDQVGVPTYDWDTGGTLHARVSEAEKGLFLKWWPRLAAGEALPTRPQSGPGSYHSRASFFLYKALDEEAIRQMNAAQVLKLIRCLSHPAYPGLLVRFGERVYEISAREVKDG